MKAPSAIDFDPEKYVSTQRRLTSSSAFLTFGKSARDVAFSFARDEETEEETEERDAAAEEEEEQGVIGVSTVPITPWEEEAMAEAGTEAAEAAEAEMVVADEEGGAREADYVAGALSASSESDSPTSLLNLHADMSAAPAPGWKVSDNVNASTASDSAAAQPRSRYARQPTSGTTSLTGFDRLASPLGRRAGMPDAGTTV